MGRNLSLPREIRGFLTRYPFINQVIFTVRSRPRYRSGVVDLVSWLEQRDIASNTLHDAGRVPAKDFWLRFDTRFRRSNLHVDRTHGNRFDPYQKISFSREGRGHLEPLKQFGLQ